MYTIPDPIERGEARCEDWAAINLHGEIFTCQCGSKCHLNDAETLSPDPYAIPVCPQCANRYYHRPLDAPTPQSQP